MYKLIYDDSYSERLIATRDNRDELLEILSGYLSNMHKCIDNCDVYSMSPTRMVYDFGSWTKFFYIDSYPAK